MTNFTALYADIILKEIVTKIKKDTNIKNKATERKMATGYERMRDLDSLTNWSEKLNQERFKFMGKFQDVLEYYNLHYKEREAE